MTPAEQINALRDSLKFDTENNAGDIGIISHLLAAAADLADNKPNASKKKINTCLELLRARDLRAMRG